MLKDEFEDKAKLKLDSVGWVDYEMVETVYTYYPGNLDKDQIAKVYEIGGMRLIKDMLPRARAIRSLEGQIRELRKLEESIAEPDWRPQ